MPDGGNNRTAFFTSLWIGVRPDLLSGAIEFGQYTILWMGVLGAHLIKVLAAVSGVEQEIIRPISFMERWVWIATFLSFFWRILIRVGRVAFRKTHD